MSVLNGVHDIFCCQQSTQASIRHPVERNHGTGIVVHGCADIGRTAACLLTYRADVSVEKTKQYGPGIRLSQGKVDSLKFRNCPSDVLYSFHCRDLVTVGVKMNQELRLNV